MTNTRCAVPFPSRDYTRLVAARRRKRDYANPASTALPRSHSVIRLWLQLTDPFVTRTPIREFFFPIPRFLSTFAFYWQGWRDAYRNCGRFLCLRNLLNFNVPWELGGESIATRHCCYSFCRFFWQDVCWVVRLRCKYSWFWNWINLRRRNVPSGKRNGIFRAHVLSYWLIFDNLSIDRTISYTSEETKQNKSVRVTWSHHYQSDHM